MTGPEILTHDILNQWADDAIKGPVALHLKQTLLPVEGEGGVIFPPTYADIGYNIDAFPDGTKVVTIDSVGAQANRIEPVFKSAPFADLVPQIAINYGNERTISILDAGHRLGDALIRCVARDEADGFDLRHEAHEAFAALRDRNDAGRIGQLAPTSLVFGAWDSRDTYAKLPRIVQSVIRAWDVEVLRRSAQYNPPIDYVKLDVFSDEDKKKQEVDPNSQLAKRGFVHVPATGALGGVVARGAIERQVTVNLVALRRLEAENASALRRYILGLSLVAASAPFDPFLRQGCILVPDPDRPARWNAVRRDGTRQPVELNGDSTLDYTSRAKAAFGVGPDRRLAFSKERAREDADKSDEKSKAKKSKAQ